ncbi:MAG: nitronate monooxygenase [Desulfatiglans sp.]|jgi:enoyl-[acyl-carrier protein] reductase II|nr:nitronate monooxygenase [Thermodesulfobacteriota bacterium]MEE4354684.1 nitronate monooxygenase [Desulfatiglans sp.]
MNNRITEILGTAYPLILGPMRRITLGEMAAAVSASGGFGQIGASGLSGEKLQAELKKAKELTDRPIGVNIPIYRPNAFEALDIAIEMGVKVVTTSAGNPAKIIDRIREAGLKVLHKVSTVEMAMKAQSVGVDGVIATGFEAGGHVGREELTTLCLVPLLVDALEIPVVAAGGICDARGFLAAMALGAEGVEVGTRFLVTHECPAPDFFKQAILNAEGGATLRLGKDAMPMRVLRNKKAEEISDPDKKKEDARMNKGGDSGYVEGNADTAIMPAGQVAALIRQIKGVSEVFPGMVREGKSLSLELSRLFTEEE